MTRRLRHVVRRNPGERPLGISSGQEKLRERGLVEERNPLAGGFVLAADRVEPVRPLIGIGVFGLLAAGKIGKPVWPLEAELLAEACPLRFELVIERRTAKRTAQAILLMRPGHGVVLGVGLERAGAHPVRVEMVLAEAANIHRPEIVRRLALGHPFGQHHAGTAAGGDAESVEARPDKNPPGLARLAKDEIAVGREAFGAVDELPDARRLHRRDASRRKLEQWLEMVEISVEKLELEPVRQAIDRPGLWVGLIAAHDKAADFLSNR